MKVIIGGCGRVGALLSSRLYAAGHEVDIIDQRSEAFERLPRSFGGHTHLGKVFDKETLEAAGIDHADAFVAVTSGDNSNIIAAVVAKDEFRVPLVLCRIFDPRRAEIYRRLGIPAVSSVAWSVNEIASVLLHPGMTTEVTFGDGEARLVSAEVPPRLVGRTFAELERPGEVDVVAVVRAGRSMLPSGDSLLEEHDVVYVAVTDSALVHLERMLIP